MIFAISDRFPRNSARAAASERKERKGRTGGKSFGKTGGTVGAPDVNQQRERERDRQRCLRIGSVWKMR